MKESKISQYESNSQHNMNEWNKYCGGVDTVFEEFQLDLLNNTAHFRKWIEETPSRVLDWVESDTNYSISVLLKTGKKTKLDLSCSAWEDNKKTQVRRTITLGTKSLNVPVNADWLKMDLTGSHFMLANIAPMLKGNFVGEIGIFSQIQKGKIIDKAKIDEINLQNPSMPDF